MDIWREPTITHLDMASLYLFPRKSDIHILLINNNTIIGINQGICEVQSKGSSTGNRSYLVYTMKIFFFHP